MIGKRTAVALTLALVVALGGGQATGQAAAGKKGKRGVPVVLNASAAYIGLDRAQLLTRLRAGQSLAQIAIASGKTVAGLKAAILNAHKARLDADVAANRLTAAQAQARLAALSARIDRIVNRVGAARPGGAKRPGGPGVLQAAATYLGLTGPELKAALRSGQSLATLATARGKSVTGLKTAMANAVKAKLDAAVAANRLTAAQAQILLARFQAQLDRIVNATRPPRRR